MECASLRVAGLERGLHDVDAKLACLRRQLRGAFDRDDLQPHCGKDRGRITRAGADHERTLSALRHHLREQLPEHRGSSEEAASAKRQAAVDISERTDSL